MAPQISLASWTIILAIVCSTQGQNDGIDYTSNWPVGNDRMVAAKVQLQAPCTMTSWTVDLTFSQPVIDFLTWSANGGDECASRQSCQLTNRYSRNDAQGSIVTFNFHAKFAGQDVPQIRAQWGSVCGGQPSLPPPPPTTTTTTTTTTTSSKPTATTPTTPTTTQSPAAQTTTTAAESSGGGIVYKSSWNDGKGNIMLDAEVQLQAPCTMTSWSVLLSFSRSAISFQTWDANNGSACDSDQVTICQLTNKYARNDQQGNIVRFSFQAKFAGLAKPHIRAQWGPVCGGQPTAPPASPTTSTTTKQPTPASHTTTTTTRQPTETPASPTTTTTTPSPPIGALYNYGEVLHKSILFYEAQRSGKLPPTNRVPWREDSALNDGSDVGRDLTGGWYDAGDGVKFNFPMASSVTMLAWGMLRHKEAYQYAGEWQNALDCIKWPLDYFIKCHVSATELYGQVGNGAQDHSEWGRVEEITVPRPSYKVTATSPGSDLAGETAAAMTAGHLVFKDTDPAYATSLLDHARKLYVFAKTYRGKYSDSITDAANFYRSYNDVDELAWSAIWLYKATREQAYLEDAKVFLSLVTSPGELSWDDKGIGASLLIYEEDQNHARSRSHVTSFVRTWLTGIPRTPKGLAWLREWGPNRYAANAAFALLVAADLGFQPTKCKEFAEQQINYVLGEGGRSYVVGFGDNPPSHPHHRSSSCPDRPAPCTWNDYNSPAPNPQTLFGALVGGPDKNDQYKDLRSDYIMNEVACDYNAGFQSAVAGLLHLYLP